MRPQVQRQQRCFIQRQQQRRQPLASLGVAHAQPRPRLGDGSGGTRREAAAGYPQPHAERARRGVEQRLCDRVLVRVEAIEAAQVGVHLTGRRLLDQWAYGSRRLDELVGGAAHARRARLEHDERRAPADGLGEPLPRAHATLDGGVGGLGHAQPRVVGDGDGPAAQLRPRGELRGERERRYEQARDEWTSSGHVHPRQEVV